MDPVLCQKLEPSVRVIIALELCFAEDATILDGWSAIPKLSRRRHAELRSAPPNEMTPWLGLQLEGLHYAQTGVIEQD